MEEIIASSELKLVVLYRWILLSEWNLIYTLRSETDLVRPLGRKSFDIGLGRLCSPTDNKICHRASHRLERHAEFEEPDQTEWGFKQWRSPIN